MQNPYIIVGIVVGGLLAMLSIILCIWCFKFKRRADYIRASKGNYGAMDRSEVVDAADDSANYSID